jgi:hypothetical protein
MRFFASRLRLGRWLNRRADFPDRPSCRLTNRNIRRLTGYALQCIRNAA